MALAKCKIIACILMQNYTHSRKTQTRNSNDYFHLFINSLLGFTTHNIKTMNA